MNLFQKYGIKEVADVVFYSITRIDDEEFYTPVLYLDTLKVSNIEQTTSEVVERGGTTNRKVIGWNYNKDVKISLEDALFSPASMNFIWGGKFNSRLSLYTETIAKLNLANKYGRLNYSVKAKPSPELTDEQWELIYEHAQKTYTASGSLKTDKDYLYNVEGEDDAFIAENRYLLKKHYINRTYEELVKSSILTIDVGKFFPLKAEYTAILEIKAESYNDEILDLLPEDIDVLGRAFLPATLTFYAKEEETKSVSFPCILRFQFKRFIDYTDIEHCYIYYQNRNGYGTIGEKNDFIKYFNVDNIFAIETPTDEIKERQSKENAVVNVTNQTKAYELFETVRGFNNTARKNSAMPQKIIDSLIHDIDRLSRMETFEHNIENKQCIDRMEKCVVTKEYFAVDTNQQKENFIKKLNDNQDSSYTIYYDYKTMLPLFQLEDDNKISLTEGTTYFLYFDNRNISNSENYIHTYPSDMTPKNQEDNAANALRIDEQDVYKIINLFRQTRSADINIESLDDKQLINTYTGLFMTFCEQINMLDFIDLNKPIYEPFRTSLLKALKAQHQKDVNFSDLKYLRLVWLPDENYTQSIINVNSFVQINTQEEKIKMALAYWSLLYELKEDNVFMLKQGTPYYKWTRTVNHYDDYTLGRSITLDTNSFLGEYKIVGETYIRDQKTQKDQRYQITLNNTRLKIDNTLNLSADGDPTVFSIEAQVFNRKNQDMIELCQYDVEEDNDEGGYRIVPQKSQYTFTPTNLTFVENCDIINNEIY